MTTEQKNKTKKSLSPIQSNCNIKKLYEKNNFLVSNEIHLNKWKSLLSFHATRTSLEKNIIDHHLIGKT